MTITGECFCSKVSYKVEGKLKDARSCHCSRCRKAFSSQASAYALVESNDFQWISGEALLTSYIGGLELEYLSLNNKIDLELAKQLGFYEPPTISFALRKTLVKK